jgi:ribosomal protein S18 acetylase RimI-like enzyme
MRASPSVAERVKAALADVQRRFHGLSRPSGADNAKRLRERGESLESVVFRDAVIDDVPLLAELHVRTWNATYRTSAGPTVGTRSAQWRRVFERADPREFVVVAESADRRLIGFAFGGPGDGDFAGVLNKIFLSWDYHGLGLGRRLMEETARRFLERGVASFNLYAERSNPSIGFYDRLGGERLSGDRGMFTGAYGWRDVRTLLGLTATRGT